MELILAAIGAVALHLIGSELYAKAPRLSTLLILYAAKRLPRPLQARYLEEWLAHSHECRGNLTKLLHAMECFVYAPSIGRIASTPSRVAEYSLELAGKRVSVDVSTLVFLLKGIEKIFLVSDPEKAVSLRESIVAQQQQHTIGDPDRNKLKEFVGVLNHALAAKKDSQRGAALNWKAENVGEKIEKR